jgi:hypothetical protein
MSNDPELLRKLIDDDDAYENIEMQKGESPAVVKGIAIDTSTYSKKKNPFRRGFGCCCKCIGITMVLFILLALGAMAYAYSCLNEVVEHLTIETDSPKKFPIVHMSDAELDKILDRVTNFVDNIEDELDDIEDLVLTQDEINAFIGHSDFLRGNLMVTLHEDRIVEEYSIPFDFLGYSDRYFVGNDYVALESYGNKDVVEMKMETEANHEDWFNGPLYFLQLEYLITKNKKDEGRNMLELYLQKGSFFGQNVPQEVIDHHENLLRELYEGADAGDEDLDVMLDVINRIESVSIEEGKVVVKARPN